VRCSNSPNCARCAAPDPRSRTASACQPRRWFADTELNFAENLLVRRDAHPGDRIRQ